jgi:cyclohexyl-isocyanide hydratase
MNRRDVGTTGLAAVGLLAAGSATAQASGPAARGAAPRAPLKIALVMYSGFTAQDLVGPYSAFSLIPNAQVSLVAKTMDPVPTIPGPMRIVPTATYETCPRDLDVIMTPGGLLGTVAAMKDPELIAFLRDRGDRARYVTSVCTGALILGAAGLLKGYKATTHWLSRDVLKEVDAVYTPGRVVVDRNRVTGGGVTAGLDFGLALTSILLGEGPAQAIQLINEYDPAPPFHAGSPETAPPQVTAQVRKLLAGPTEQMRLAAVEAARQPGF